MTAIRKASSPPRGHASSEASPPPALSAWGTVDGVVDTITLRPEPVVTLREHGSGAVVRCRVPEAMAGHLAGLPGKTVRIFGLVRYAPSGQASRVDEVSRIERLEPPIYRLTDLSGAIPDFTGGVDPAEYIESLRDVNDA